MLACVGFGVAAGTLGMAVPAAVASDVTKRDHLVFFNKRTVWASEVRARKAVSARVSHPMIPSSGRFVRVGKASVWVPKDQADAIAAQRTESPSSPVDAGSRGRFVQRGKATVWVPADATK